MVVGVGEEGGVMRLEVGVGGLDGEMIVLVSMMLFA